MTVPEEPVTVVRPVAGTLAAQAYGSLVAVGISHRTATLELREQAAVTEPVARALLGDLRSVCSVSAAAVLSTCNGALGDLRRRRALVLGAGSMASSRARALRRNGVEGMVVANRTPAAARELADGLGGRGVRRAGLAAELAWADLVVACIRAPAPVLRRQEGARAVRVRRGRPLVCIDAAMPRDIEPTVASLDGVVRLDADDLRLTADANLADRALEPRRGEAIVAAEVARCLERARRQRLATAA